MPYVCAVGSLELPRNEVNLGHGAVATVSRNDRWAPSRMARYCFHCPSVSLAGTVNQSLPFRGNDPRFPPVMRRLTMYFQYALCSTISAML